MKKITEIHFSLPEETISALDPGDPLKNEFPTNCVLVQMTKEEWRQISNMCRARNCDNDGSAVEGHEVDFNRASYVIRRLLEGGATFANSFERLKKDADLLFPAGGQDGTQT